jgi:hypothetical protein
MRDPMLRSLAVLFFVLGTSLARAECRPLESQVPELEIAGLAGQAILYPMDTSRHTEITKCLFAQYVHPKRSLASLSGSVTNALLRIMAADPERFFTVLTSVPRSQKQAWYSAFELASLVHLGQCPKPDAWQLARSAATQARLNGPVGAERRATLAALHGISCRIPG